MTKTVEQESFFNFFKSIQMPDEKELEDNAEDLEEEKNIGEKMDEDLEMANEFKDQLIPLALEYYMEVIDMEGEDGSDAEDDDDDEDDEGKGKKDKQGSGSENTGGNKKKGGKKGGKGGDKKQEQECK